MTGRFSAGDRRFLDYQLRMFEYVRKVHTRPEFEVEDNRSPKDT